MEVVRVAVSRELVSDSERTIRSRLQLADPVLTENMVQAVFEWLSIGAARHRRPGRQHRG
jgi:hypothetical protein